MEKYKILCELNRKEQFGEEITEEEKTAAVSCFLDGRNDSEEIIRYKKKMRVNPNVDCVYPNYYLPPYNEGKKLRLVQGYLPKTNILYANHYEAEILRLLVKFAPDNETVKDMAYHTLERYSKTCFGNSCTKGECVTTGICVLRLLAAVQVASQNKIPLSYLLMAFTDINNDNTRNFLRQKKEWLAGLLRRGWLTGKLSNGKISEGDTYNLLSKFIIRNAVCTLPEFSKKEDYRIYIDDVDERCYCEILE